MGRKGGLASIFSSKSKLAATDSPSPPWAWPSCATSPQTASFRRQGRHDDDDRPCTTEPVSAAGGRLRQPRKAALGGDDMYKTVNSVYFDSADSCRFFFDDDGDACEAGEDAVDDLDDGSFSTTTASEEWSEAVIRSLGRTSTDRFFFDASPSPGRTTTRALLVPPPEAPKLQALSFAAAALSSDEPNSSEEGNEDDEPASTSLVEESVAVALDSEDPFRDFRSSMEEMVAAHGLRDWAALQEMLLWYLRINGKHNHALIVGAFVDLLVGLATSNTSISTTAATMTTTTTTATMTTTATSCSTSSSSSSASSSGGGDVTTAAGTAAAAAATITMEEQCGGGSAGASCSSASSDLEEEEKASDGHCTSSGALDSPPCS